VPASWRWSPWSPLWDAGDEVGSELPEAYFEAAASRQIQQSVENPACNSAFIGVAYLAPRQFKVIFEAAVRQNRASDTLCFMIKLGDRRDHVDCRHPGAPDRYFLSVMMTLDDEGEIIDATFNEEVQLGPI
jgi:hypothetical protein